MVKGFNADASNWIEAHKVNVPISAVALSSGDRASLVLAKRTAEAKARLKTVQDRVIEPVPTPAPKNVHTSMGGTAHVPQFPAAAPTPTLTSTPAPLWGAVYTGGNPSVTLKVGQVVMVPVTVHNTSSQTWTSAAQFHLSFHWLRGGIQFVRDGDRTFLPGPVAPGATVSLSAKVTAPATTGATVLQWDMVQEGVAWFSDRGVPMSAPKSVNVVP